jgi:hypothetical protein
MKHRYINIKILLACLAKKPGINKDIHVQLQETIAEHKRIMKQFTVLLLPEADLSLETAQRQAA